MHSVGALRLFPPRFIIDVRRGCGPMRDRVDNGSTEAGSEFQAFKASK